MTAKTYHVVTTAGGTTKASPPMSRDTALAHFDTVRRAPGFLPHGGGRARVVDERQWQAIQAMAARRSS